MRFLMFLLVVMIMVGFNALHCRDVPDSPQTDMDTIPLKSRVARSADATTFKQKGKCACNGTNKDTRQCFCKTQGPLKKLRVDGRRKCIKKGIQSYEKCKSLPVVKISTPI